jgi:predicted O-linked N-acetylglucosamine transferase (SPINDLY family)
MPHTYFTNHGDRRMSKPPFTRTEVGLPESGFVYCCFNNHFKIAPAVFDPWVTILRAVDGSILWLRDDNPTSRQNLRREAEARGVDGDRLVFAPLIPLEDHLPYTAHSMASDALWAGLPLLTQEGRSLAGRVAASLLHTLGLPELITRSQSEYETMAITLARDPALLAGLRTRLAESRTTSPFFNTGLYMRHLEAAYQAMINRHQQSLPPADIDITAP